MFPATEKNVKRDDWIFVQDNDLLHRSNLVPDLLEKTLKCRFIKYLEWPPSSPDVNWLGFEQLNSFSLDYEPLKKNRDIL